MKKLISIFMCLAILASSVIVAGAADTGALLGATKGTCGDNLKWNYDSSTKTLTISGKGPMEEFEIQEAPWIKNDLNIYNLIIEEGVTSIGERAFLETSVKQVSFPTTLTAIGSNAFCSCMNLEEVILPENLTKIDAAAFSHCWGLKSIIIPKSVIIVGNSAFEECEDMTDITFLNPECEIYKNISTIYKTTTIHGAENSTAQAYAEKYNRNFIKIDIAPSKPAGNCGENANWEFDADTATLTISGSGAMADYHYNNNPTPWSIYEIEKVVIADGITTIGNSAFADLVNLTDITIPDSVTAIGAYAFRECESLKSITLPDTITSLGEGAFCGCRGFKSFTIPSKVTTLNEAVLAACQSLESIYIPANVTEIHKNAFQGSASVKQIEVDPENPVYDSRENSNSIIITDSNVLFLGCKSTTIPASVTAIDDDAFDIDFGPSDIVIPGNVKTIGKYAFQACRANTITVHDGVEIIDDYAFATAQGPTTIVLPKSVKYIGYCAFGYSTITDITIPNPECEIFDHTYTLPNLKDSVIRGTENSTAQQYAEKYNRKFELYVEPEFELGDVDKDGVISVIDATEIQMVISKLKTFADDDAEKLADVDADGEVSVMDATAIQMKIAKIE